MTTGAVIFAQNNSSIDYTKLAVYAANRVSTYLDIPVTLITDNKLWLEEKYPSHSFSNVIEISSEFNNQQKRFYDGSLSSKVLDWKNLSRGSVYDLSPYNTTLVLDSDYIISSSVLKSALDTPYDFQIYKKSFDLAGWRISKEFERINQYSIPFYWATVFVFKKGLLSQTLFDLVNYIKQNWFYFRILYSIESELFRNDFAFSIAIHILNGKTNGEFASELPGTMTFTTDKDILLDVDSTKLKFLLEKEGHLGEYIAASARGIDIHILNKYSLSRFIDGGTGV